jgi:hypothetical protein
MCTMPAASWPRYSLAPSLSRGTLPLPFSIALSPHTSTGGAETCVTTTAALCSPPPPTATPAPPLRQDMSDALRLWGPSAPPVLLPWPPPPLISGCRGQAATVYHWPSRVPLQVRAGLGMLGRCTSPLVRSHAGRIHSSEFRPLPALYEGRREEKKLILGSRCEVSDSGKQCFTVPCNIRLV